MVLGNHQHVSRSLRINILERNRTLVFIHFLGRDLSSNNAAKQAVFHIQSPSEAKAVDLTIPVPERPHRASEAYQSDKITLDGTTQNASSRAKRRKISSRGDETGHMPSPK